MSSFLQNQLKNQIAVGFKNKLLNGTLTRKNQTSINEFGDVVSSGFETYKVEGFTAQFDDYYRTKFGIPNTDLKIILIAGNCQVVPVKEDIISFRGRNFQIRNIKTDPAEATWIGQAYEVQS